MGRYFFSALLLLASFTFAGTPSLALPDSIGSLVTKTTELTMALRYDEALKAAKQLEEKDPGVGCIIKSVVRVSMYDDKGDTTALIKAGNELGKCRTNGLWDALRKFELGYIESESGHSVKGAVTTRSAAKKFEESEDLEARAFYAIYAYYVDQSFSWVPFKSDNREKYLSILDSASIKSENFWPLFLTPLIWMHYDKEDFNTGLNLAERGLKKAPNHPVFLQIKADMLYRLKRFNEAASIYEQSASNYQKRTGKTIRYWCSVLNLIRIYNDMGNQENAQKWKTELSDPSYKQQERWMPSSLLDDLKKRKIL